MNCVHFIHLLGIATALSRTLASQNTQLEPHFIWVTLFIKIFNYFIGQTFVYGNKQRWTKREQAKLFIQSLLYSRGVGHCSSAVGRDSKEDWSGKVLLWATGKALSSWETGSVETRQVHLEQWAILCDRAEGRTWFSLVGPKLEARRQIKKAVSYSQILAIWFLLLILGVECRIFGLSHILSAFLISEAGSCKSQS